ncbi:MAG: hypothetical protein BWY84_00219 [Candidatus Aerophobetes bacterium ADurb.Bin490]|nr:MAG: hypothetical protein BWY84_00219 [Candidatus Aerophobetes bacterium ADurb.Bin490]
MVSITGLVIDLERKKAALSEIITISTSAANIPVIAADISFCTSSVYVPVPIIQSHSLTYFIKDTFGSALSPAFPLLIHL